MSYKILVINPGSTSTKFAVFKNKECVFKKSINHSITELNKFEKIIDQLDYREKIIRDELNENDFSIDSFDAVAARGGRVQPVPSGVYLVNNRLIEDSQSGVQGDHASNLACLIGNNLVKNLNTPVYIVDPVSTDELSPIARISGCSIIERNSLSHALNMKEIAKKTAQKINKEYKECRLIIVHLGGGGSISVHKNGKMIDLYNSDKEGPFSIERSGTIPALDLVDVCFSGQMNKKEIKEKLAGAGGVYSYLGTKDMKVIQEKINNGDYNAKLIIDAYIYQIAKYVGAMASVLEGDIDAISITGGVANSDMIMEKIKDKINYLGQIYLFPGEEELNALAHNVLKVLQGEKNIREY